MLSFACILWKIFINFFIWNKELFEHRNYRIVFCNLRSSIPRCRRPNRSICFIDVSSQSVCDALRSIFQRDHFLFRSSCILHTVGTRISKRTPSMRYMLLFFLIIIIGINMYFSIIDQTFNHSNLSTRRTYFGWRKFSKSILSMTLPLLLVPTTNDGWLLLFFMGLPPASRAPIYRNKNKRKYTYEFPSSIKGEKKQHSRRSFERFLRDFTRTTFSWSWQIIMIGHGIFR